MPAILDGVEIVGMTMWAGMEKVDAASASAWAWLPEVSARDLRSEGDG